MPSADSPTVWEMPTLQRTQLEAYAQFCVDPAHPSVALYFLEDLYCVNPVPPPETVLCVPKCC